MQKYAAILLSIFWFSHTTWYAKYGSCTIIAYYFTCCACYCFAYYLAYFAYYAYSNMHNMQTMEVALLLCILFVHIVHCILHCTLHIMHVMHMTIFTTWNLWTLCYILHIFCIFFCIYVMLLKYADNVEYAKTYANPKIKIHISETSVMIRILHTLHIYALPACRWSCCFNNKL